MGGIPTLYKGVQFRSRLEAKWACFFDLLGQKWQYEPFDLPGWIPDFCLNGGKGFFRKALIEVKPTFENSSEVFRKMNRSMMMSPEHHQHNLLLISCGPVIPDHGYPLLGIGGWINPCACYRRAWKNGQSFEDNPVHRPVDPDKTSPWHDTGTAYLSISSLESNDLIAYHTDGYEDYLLELKNDDTAQKAMEKSRYLASFMWTYSCNETQWKKPASR